MNEIGVVVEKRSKGLVVVEVDRRSACGRCHARGACQSTLQPRKARVIASDPIDAAVGQQVGLELADSGFLGACFHAFVVPLVALLAGAALGLLVASAAGWSAGQDGLAALGALGGVCWGLARMRGVERRLQDPGSPAARRYQLQVNNIHPESPLRVNPKTEECDDEER